jgi:hypothetical protein
MLLLLPHGQEQHKNVLNLILRTLTRFIWVGSKFEIYLLGDVEFEANLGNVGAKKSFPNCWGSASLRANTIVLYILMINTLI